MPTDETQTSSQVLINAIQQMQETQQLLVSALEALSNHDLDENAHEEIRKLIYALQDSETIYTREQIRAIIRDVIGAHTSSDYMTAHPGFTEKWDSLQLQLAEIENNVSILEQKVNGTYNANQTAMEAELRAIEERYAVLLNNLQTAFSNAEASGATELATQYRNTIAITLDEKKAEILEVLNRYMS